MHDPEDASLCVPVGLPYLLAATDRSAPAKATRAPQVEIVAAMVGCGRNSWSSSVLNRQLSFVGEGQEVKP